MAARQSDKQLPQQRQIAKNVLRKALLNHSKLASKDPEYIDMVLRRMERDCYNKTIQQCRQEFLDPTWQNIAFIGRYQSLIYLYASNLDPSSSLSSDSLAEKILSGEVLPENITSYTSKDINPEASSSERAMIETRQQQKVDKKYTTRYQCSKCFARKAEISEVQRLRADEVSSNRLVCLECSHVWFKNGV
jgi:DNA-directed RNA polymerase subunit M/transcription elongation factor TFIIS